MSKSTLNSLSSSEITSSLLSQFENTQTYNIVITEQQRKIIELALKNINNNKELSTIRINNNLESDFEESKILFDMTVDLPKQESENPDIIHGFAC